MRVTKAELEAQVAHYKRQNFYIMTTVMLLWVVALTIMLTYEYKGMLAREASAEKYVEQSLDGWQTEVIPAPDNRNFTPQHDGTFKWPNTPWIDARSFIQSLSPITSANAAHHKLGTDLPPSRVPFASPLKLWTIEQLASDRVHVACSATRSMPSGVIVSVTAYKNGMVELLIDRASFFMSETQPYGDAVISVDNAVFVQTTAKRISDYTTSLDLSSLPLTQLANGKILRVTVNGFYFEFDLTGSANAAKYVNACNVSGQTKVWERRVAAASPAVVLETTKP